MTQISKLMFCCWIIAACLLLATGCLKQESVSHSKSSYGRYVKIWKQENHALNWPFPNEVPEGATNYSATYFPGELQAGSWLYVKYNLPEADIKQCYAIASDKAIKFYDGGTAFKLLEQSEDELLGPTCKLIACNQDGGYPDDYRIFIYDAKSYDGKSWNHGHSTGVVISLKNHEIIYYADVW